MVLLKPEVNDTETCTWPHRTRRKQTDVSDNRAVNSARKPNQDGLNATTYSIQLFLCFNWITRAIKCVFGDFQTLSRKRDLSGVQGSQPELNSVQDCNCGEKDLI